jgi:thiamine pyrophosphokinase
MGVPTLEVGYTSATTGRGDHEVHKGHVVALGNNNNIILELCLTECSVDIALLQQQQQDGPHLDNNSLFHIPSYNNLRLVIQGVKYKLTFSRICIEVPDRAKRSYLSLSENNS